MTQEPKEGPTHRTDTCSTCRFWGVVGFDDPVGECQRGPPAATPREEDLVASAVWTVTRRDEWCGEHRKEADWAAPSSAGQERA